MNLFLLLLFLLPIYLEGQQSELPREESLILMSGEPQIEMNRHNRELRDSPAVISHLPNINREYVESHTFPWSNLFLFCFLFFALPLFLIYIMIKSRSCTKDINGIVK